MYKTIKQSLKTIIPKKILFKNELFFRWFYALIYTGNKHQCNICLKKLRAFIPLSSHDLLCPACGSRSRTRRLWLLLNKNNHIHGNVLHFSPSRSIYRKLKKNSSIKYFSSDFEDEFLADYKFDITSIDQDDEKFDTIICYHILEHIIEDIKAMSELYRVLKPEGTICIQTPFKEGDIYEDYSITSRKEREIHFGQDDHVRIYSMDGLKNRLENVGFKVSINTFKQEKIDNYKGFLSPEMVFTLNK